MSAGFSSFKMAYGPAQYFKDKRNYHPKKFFKWVDANATQFAKLLMPILMYGKQTITGDKAEFKMLTKPDVLSDEGFANYEFAFGKRRQPPGYIDEPGAQRSKITDITDEKSSELGTSDVDAIPDVSMKGYRSKPRKLLRTKEWDITYTDKGMGRNRTGRKVRYL
jgi:hypothetical protein